MSEKIVAREVNFDGLVGPSHHYAGLAFGNVASEKNKQSISNPRHAALQGLKKIQWMREQGVAQAVLPPQFRPNFRVLHELGFRGSEQAVLSKVFSQAPELLSMCCSASSMWTANAATVAPSSDTENGKLCITPSNLISNLHRHLESNANYELLKYVFANSHYFVVNRPLPSVRLFSDEGAANHMRLVDPVTQKSLHIMVYGSDPMMAESSQYFPARQTLGSSKAITRLNYLTSKQTLYLQQSKAAIDKGVFHNDVIALSHNDLLLCHEFAFEYPSESLSAIRGKGEFSIIEIPNSMITIDEAVASYIFNSQIVSAHAGKLKMVLPIECRGNRKIQTVLEHSIKHQAKIDEFVYMDLQQSMKNGGGPACLRLRIDLTDQEMSAMQGELFVDDQVVAKLINLVEDRYPESLSLQSLSSWPFCQNMLDSVHTIYELLKIPSALFSSVSASPAL